MEGDFEKFEGEEIHLNESGDSGEVSEMLEQLEGYELEATVLPKDPLRVPDEAKDWIQQRFGKRE
jgi:hypothetical protein